MSYMGKVRPTIALTSDDIEDGAILNVDVNASAAIANSKMATDTTNATNLATGTVPTARLGSGTASSSTFLTGAQTYAAVDTSGITANQDDIALLGFKVAANGSLARYNLVDQSIDAFEDASGVDASASTNEVRDSSGNYYSGTVVGSLVAKTASGTYTPGAGITGAEILVVAGGGGGGDAGSGAGGGGGAGGVVHITGYTLVPGVEYDITVGDGGANGSGGSPPGEDGDNSVFNVNAEGSGLTMTAIGGGGGGQDGEAGRDGGSGGGEGADESADAPGSGTQGDSGGGTGYGNDGGEGSTEKSGGGGGASAVGADANGTAGDGGAGKLFAGFEAYGTTSGNVASSGSDGGYFAGGGGGGANTDSGDRGSGGVGGGARGTYDETAVNALDNTGGGGAGPGAGGTGNGSDGAAGVVLIKEGVTNDMTLISNAQTANDGAPDNGDLVITYSDGAGTAVANTNIKAYISRDGSAYTSAVTLVSQGTTGGHTILTANGVDLSGITSGTSMRWKIETLVQSASMETRIQAVSLGWS